MSYIYFIASKILNYIEKKQNEYLYENDYDNQNNSQLTSTPINDNVNENVNENEIYNDYINYYENCISACNEYEYEYEYENFIHLERKILYNPSKSIIFARLYARRTGRTKIDYRKIIALNILKNKPEKF